MATKSKLERAVEDGAGRLNDAQREIVLSQLRDYKRNRARIDVIDSTLSSMDKLPVAGVDGARVSLAQRTALVAERGKLAEANNAISSRLFEQLGD